MQTIERLRSSALWFLLPSVAVATAVGTAIASYEPATFDPSLYVTQEAKASELDDIDASEIAEPSEAADVELDDLADAGELQDGLWTGHAVCGQGNTAGWQPYYVAVTIEVKDGKVARIVDISGSATGAEGSTTLSWDPSESQRYLDLATIGHADDGVRQQMEAQIAAQGLVSSIDVVSGATYSSAAIYQAYADAVAQAGGEAPAVSGVQPTTSADSPSSPVPVTPTNPKAKYANGTWTGYAVCGKGNGNGWSPYYVAVTVKVKGGKVKAVTNIVGSATGEKGATKLSWNASESGRYLMWAIGGHGSSTGLKTQFNNQLSKKGSVSSVDTVSGATYSSNAIVEAYGAALSKSAKAAGSKTPTKKPKTPTKKPGTPSEDQEQQVDPGAELDLGSTKLADGTWLGRAACGVDNGDDWNPYYVHVAVTVEDGKVTDVSDVSGSATGDEGDETLSWDADINQRYLDWAAKGRTKGGVTYRGVPEQAKEALGKGDALSGVDVVSGATYSSNAIAKACYDALGKSAAAAGSTYEEPDDQGGGNTDDPSDTPVDTPGSGSEGDGGDDGSGTEGGGGDPSQPVEDDGPVTGSLVDGEYVGHGCCEDPTYEDDWDAYYVLVRIRVENGFVTQVVDVQGDQEGVVDPRFLFDISNATYLNRAINGTTKRKGIVSQINEKLAAGAEVTGIDLVSSATFSSRAILEGYADAVAKAQ